MGGSTTRSATSARACDEQAQKAMSVHGTVLPAALLGFSRYVNASTARLTVKLVEGSGTWQLHACKPWRPLLAYPQPSPLPQVMSFDRCACSKGKHRKQGGL